MSKSKLSLPNLLKTAIKASENDTELLIQALSSFCEDSCQTSSADAVYADLWNRCIKLIRASAKETSSNQYILRVLNIIDKLLQTAPVFRIIVAGNLQTLTNLLHECGVLSATGSDIEPITDYFLELIEIWSVTYRQQLPSFLAVRRHINESLQIAVPTIQERLDKLQRSKQAKAMEEQRAMLTVFKEINEQYMESTKVEIESCMERIQDGFDTLFCVEDSHLAAVAAVPTTNNNAEQFHGNMASNQLADQAIPDLDFDNIAWETDAVDDDEENDGKADGNISQQLEEGYSYSYAVLPVSMEIVIDPNLINHPNKEEIMANISDSAKDMIRLFTLLLKWKKKILDVYKYFIQSDDDQVVIESTSSSSNSGKKRKVDEIKDTNSGGGVVKVDNLRHLEKAKQFLLTLKEQLKYMKNMLLKCKTLLTT